jgi:hypothetical protein
MAGLAARRPRSAGSDCKRYDWVLAFNAEGPAGLVNGKAPGNTPLLTQAHRQALLRIVESGPIPAGSRRGPLAADRPGAMGIRGIPYFD